MERDFNTNVGDREAVGHSAPREDRRPLDRMKEQLGSFLRFTVANLIDEPDRAKIAVKEMGPAGLCFQVALAERDVALLIGREGHTAAAIRRILQATGGRAGIQVLLHIQASGADAG